MARFLGPAWIAAFNDAVADVGLPPPPEDSGLAVRDGTFATCVIAQDESGDTVSVTLAVSDGRLTMMGSASADAAVTVRVGWDDAVRFLAGAWAPTPALASGRAQVRGDLWVLRATGVALETLQPHLAGLRADTEDGKLPGP